MKVFFFEITAAHKFTWLNFFGNRCCNFYNPLIQVLEASSYILGNDFVMVQVFVNPRSTSVLGEINCCLYFPSCHVCNVSTCHCRVPNQEPTEWLNFKAQIAYEYQQCNKKSNPNKPSIEETLSAHTHTFLRSSSSTDLPTFGKTGNRADIHERIRPNIWGSCNNIEQ